jgi:hypothetical protein
MLPAIEDLNSYMNILQENRNHCLVIFILITFEENGGIF